MEYHPNTFLENEPLAKEIDWRGPASVESFNSAADGLIGGVYAGNGEGQVLGHEGNEIALFDASVALLLAYVLPKIFERLDAFLGLDVGWGRLEGVYFNGDGHVAGVPFIL